VQGFVRSCSFQVMLAKELVDKEDASLCKLALLLFGLVGDLSQEAFERALSG
jgi:hypothetical protein